MTNDTVHSYTYDTEGNITKVDGGSTAQYVYDVFNQRIHVQTASATNEYVYNSRAGTDGETPVIALPTFNTHRTGYVPCVPFDVGYVPGSTVTKSPGSGPPVVEPSVGTRVPVSFSVGQNFPVNKGGC